MGNHETQGRKPAALLAMAAIAVISVGAMSGCSTTSGIEGSAATTWGVDGDMQMSRFVVINNPDLARGIQIVDLKSSYVGDLLKGNVTLVSKKSDTRDYQYKFIWFDLQGIEIEPDKDPWKPLIMYGNESKTIQGVAPTPKAREFKVKIREDSQTLP